MAGEEVCCSSPPPLLPPPPSGLFFLSFVFPTLLFPLPISTRHGVPLESSWRW